MTRSCLILRIPHIPIFDFQGFAGVSALKIYLGIVERTWILSFAGTESGDFMQCLRMAISEDPAMTKELHPRATPFNILLVTCDANMEIIPV